MNKDQIEREILDQYILITKSCHKNHVKNDVVQESFIKLINLVESYDKDSSKFNPMVDAIMWEVARYADYTSLDIREKILNYKGNKYLLAIID